MWLGTLLLAAAVVFDSVSFAHPWPAAQRPTNPKPIRDYGTKDAPDHSSCPHGNELHVTAPLKNVFAELQGSEVAEVISFLHKQSSLNLTAAKNATSWDNIIFLLELLQPNKSDVLPYLNGGGVTPDRYARAVIRFAATEEPYLEEYMVGPLPVGKRTTLRPLNYLCNKGSCRQRIHDADWDEEAKFYGEIGTSIEDITLGLWNRTHRGQKNDTLLVKGFDPLWFEDGRAVVWSQFWSMPEAPIDDRLALLPLGLYVKTDITGRDRSKWQVKGWYYNGEFYSSTEAFRKAFSSVKFEKQGANTDGPWSRTSRLGEELPRDTIPPPMPIQPEGPRFGVDFKEKYVEWMDFSFYIGFSRDAGLRLYDIRYKKERIIYELGLEEALSHYASSDPMQSGTAFLDSYDGFGRGAMQLVSGYDCPSYATYLNTSYYTDDKTITHINSICLFEMDAGYPIQHHGSIGFISVTKNIIFTLRSISTVGNYDFIFDYAFYLDGSVHVTVRLSGYIQAAYWVRNSDYGFKIHDNLSGSMHDHVINYKLDMDINGTANSLMKTSFVPAKEKYPWSDGKTINTMKLQKSFIKNENDARLNFAENGPSMFAIVNKEAPNQYGEYRGYRIVPSSHNIAYLTVVNSTNLRKSANWAKHHLYVLQQKDTELHSASPYNALDPGEPVIDFDKFIDGESLDQKDLVVYFNLGMHHVPDTSDLPNTITTHAHSSMAIIPHNFLSSNPSRATRQQVRVDFGKGKPSVVNKYGSRPATCRYDMNNAFTNLASYKGDIAIHKFPYDPQNPLFPDPSG